ncbi:hypothetical protein MVEN_02401200 [Mycena venus]|uniref:MYND-type domain-containing protein n=1 Tax=Mycena venus TaxID=2733690 RepID=A0A8H7CEW7_9AGAR|nr:hypothetical protein MVEN_02401200 [Mycena venus]
MSTIHKALLFQNTLRLPLSTRRIALAAAKGSLQDASAMLAMIQSQSLAPPEAELFLPVLYVLLDPSPIPEGDALERIITTETFPPSSISCAAVALDALRALIMVSSIWGGSYGDLASMVIKHISIGLACREPYKRAMLLTFVLHFSRKADVHEGFSSALISSGIIEPLISTLDSLTNTTEHIAQTGVSRGFKILRACLQVEPIHLTVAKAVRAGLLRVIISCAVKSPQEDVRSEFNWLVITVLPRTLVFHAVVVAMRDCFGDARAAAAQIDGFSTTDLFPSWNALGDLVDYRIGVLNSWESTGMPGPSACNHCGNTKAIKEFKRCAGCERTYYCSSECQRIDWRVSHRAACPILSHNSFFNKSFTRRERGFIHALIDADHARLRFQTCFDSVCFMHSHPETPLTFFVQLDYTNGRPVPSVLSTSNLAKRPLFQIHAIVVGRGPYLCRY